MQVAAEALEFAAERLAQVQTVQVRGLRELAGTWVLRLWGSRCFHAAGRACAGLPPPCSLPSCAHDGAQVFAQEQREAEAFAALSDSGLKMAERYAMFQVRGHT